MLASGKDYCPNLLLEIECTSLQALLGFSSAKMCLKNHSSLWRQQQKVHCCSYTPSGILYKTETETSGRVNIASPTHCCMHSENHLFLLMDETKSHGFDEEQRKKLWEYPETDPCTHNVSGDMIIKLLSSLVISRAHQVLLQPAQSMLICIWMDLVVCQASHLES